VRICTIVGILAMLACTGPRSQLDLGSRRALNCADLSLTKVQHFDPAWKRMLSGTYQLTLVDTVGRGTGPSNNRIELTLRAADSAYRARFATPQLGRMRGDRAVVGIADFPSRAPMQPAPSVASRLAADPPEVALIDSVLLIGGIDALDGGGYRLFPQLVTDDGFRGRWAYSGGIAVIVDTATGEIFPWPAGYFCAIRGADVPRDDG